MQDEGIRITGDESGKLKVKPLKLFKSIVNILKDLSPTNAASLPADIVEVAETLAWSDDPGYLAKMLISRSLVDALLNIIVENNKDFLKDDIETEQLDKKLETVLSDHDFFIDNNFFERPEQSPFFDTIKPLLIDFLRLFDFGDGEIELIYGRLKSYFVFSLVKEWRSNDVKYRKIEASLKTPFDAASRREGDWLIYGRYLEREIDRPVFSELFSLRQIYVPLRGYFKKRKKKEDQEKSTEGLDFSVEDRKSEMIVIDLEEEVFRWLKSKDKQDAIKVVRGGPGYGKSSFMKMLAANLLKQNYKVIFIPLHRLELKDDLVEAVKEFIKYDRFLTFDPFEEESLILIFDGLDELSMQGKLLADTANSFISEVHKKVFNYNSQKTRLQVLISGRDVIIQQNENEFRKDGQILSILPYHVNEEERKEYKDDSKLLDVDQRDKWWVNYGELNGKGYGGLPSDLKKNDFEEITAQPLLNYLIAISYERGRIDFTKETNLNLVYNDLLDAVYERAYDPAKIHAVVKKMQAGQFRRMLEEIAVASWHGNGRTTTVQEIEKHFNDAGLNKILDAFVHDAEKGIVSLLVAFYFRQAGTEQSGYQTFEFTHKSFGEYLTAKSIARVVKILAKRYNEHASNVDEGWTIKECLRRWIELFGNKALDKDIIRFVEKEFYMIAENGEDDLSQIQITIVEFINYILYNGMPIETLNPRPSYGYENELAKNAEKALLILHGIISGLTKIISDISWSSKESFGKWISLLLEQRVGPHVLVMKYLNNVKVSYSILHLKDLYGSNMSFSDMSFADMTMANLMRSNLSYANLSGANLSEANLENAELKGTNVKRDSTKKNK